MRNGASRWLLLYEYNTMHGLLDIKKEFLWLLYIYRQTIIKWN